MTEPIDPHVPPAQQEAQRASYVVDSAKQEKQSIIVKAEGEAKAAQLIGEVYMRASMAHPLPYEYSGHQE